jgi:hypothetical protein
MVRNLILRLAPCMLCTHMGFTFCYNPQLPISPSPHPPRHHHVALLTPLQKTVAASTRSSQT